jgi:hypothetical protein
MGEEMKADGEGRKAEMRAWLEKFEAEMKAM